MTKSIHAAEAAEVALEVHALPIVIERPFESLKGVFSESWSLDYDGYAASGASPADRIVLDDVLVINSAMGARSPHGDWRGLVRRNPLPQLVAIDSGWDAVLMTNAEWQHQRVEERVAALLKTVMGRPGIGPARASKVLHLKRPALIPVCDSRLLRVLGIAETQDDAILTVLRHLRGEGQRLEVPLKALQERLAREGWRRPLIRILEVLVWGSTAPAFRGGLGSVAKAR
jgi:hypothetical protein